MKNKAFGYLFSVICIVFLCMILCLSAYAFGERQIEDVALSSDNRSAGFYTCVFDGVKHDFILDIPEDPEGSALVIMLHGYGSTAESFRRDTGFHIDANPAGYSVVYVGGASNPEDRTSAAGWNYEGDEKGNRDVEFLTALAACIGQQYHTDSERCFAVGFSNGGFMCHRLALEAADTFAAAVSVAGTMPEGVWENRPAETGPGPDAGFFQITGEKDDTVPKNSDGSARYARSPAIEDVIEYYAEANCLDQSETTPEGKASALTKYSGSDTDRQVWHLIVKDGRHSWSGETVTGIDTNQLVLEFLNVQ